MARLWSCLCYVGQQLATDALKQVGLLGLTGARRATLRRRRNPRDRQCVCLLGRFSRLALMTCCRCSRSQSAPTSVAAPFGWGDQCLECDPLVHGGRWHPGGEQSLSVIRFRHRSYVLSIFLSIIFIIIGIRNICIILFVILVIMAGPMSE